MQKHRSFVIADIPGIIEGASEGAGLGIRFLKHLTRCRILLHIVDLMPIDGSDPVENARGIERELIQFSPTLSRRERWLVLNKCDLLDGAELEGKVAEIVEALAWKGKTFAVSALAKRNTSHLCEVLLTTLEQRWQLEKDDAEQREAERAMQTRMQAEVREKIAALRNKERNLDERDEGDDFDVEVEYRP